MSGLIVSQSGIRGIVGETLTPYVALDVGVAFGHFVSGGVVVVGGDTRPSHEMLKQAVVAGLTSVGCSVIDIGKVPTPTVQQAIRHHQAAGGIVITASHNPAPWNGLKLMQASGSFLDDAAYEQFQGVYANRHQLVGVPWDRVGQCVQDPDAIQRHVNRIVSVIEMPDVSHLSVLVDANHGTGCLATPVLLDVLGVRYDLMQSDGDGYFSHPPEPVRANLDGIVSRMQSGGYDIGFVQDPDADRLVVIDDQGRYIGEDYTLGLCVDYLLSTNNAVDSTVVINLSTSALLHDIVARHQAQLIQTKIGETHVTQALMQHGGLIGGEGNGGVIYPEVGWGRDSLVGMALLLKALVTQSVRVSQWADQFDRYEFLKASVPVTDSMNLEAFIHALGNQFSDYTANDADGLKLMGPDGWIHVRSSNTEPIVRIFIEAKTQELCQAMMAQVKAVMAND